MRFYGSVPSVFGEVRVVWGHDEGGVRVHRVFLPGTDTSATELAEAFYPDASRGYHPTVANLVDGMARFLKGEPVFFDVSLLALDRCTDFQRRVLLAEREIPRGWVSTYGRIARHLGVPGGARAVGNALARNPFPILIPCHRAIRADGRLGGFQGGCGMKRALLTLEGVAVSEDGRVLTDRVAY